MIRFRFVAWLAIAFFASAQAASAHVVLAEPEAAANSYYVAEFRVGHGCGDAPTTALRVEIPASVAIARPQPKPGWSLEIAHETLPAPIASEYGPVTERVSAVTWRGDLPADQYDAFALMLRLPNEAGPLAFPVVQTCAGAEVRWTESASDGARPAHPAPTLRLTPAAPSEHAHH